MKGIEFLGGDSGAICVYRHQDVSWQSNYQYASAELIFGHGEGYLQVRLCQQELERLGEIIHELLSSCKAANDALKGSAK